LTRNAEVKVAGTEIETPRLALRPWGEHDIDRLVLGLNDLSIAKWLAIVPHPYLPLTPRTGSRGARIFRRRALGRRPTNSQSNSDRSVW
jgi:hypothetical protein